MSATPPGPIGPRYNELAGRNLDRLAGLSDGVFAVGMTLLVLTLAVPAIGSAGSETDLLAAVARLAPSVLIYAMSFMTLGIFWMGQQTQMSQIVGTNRNYAWLQLAFLFGVTLVPFSTALLAHYPTRHVALLFYWLNLVLLGLLLSASFEYALRSRLIAEERRHEIARLIRGRVWIAQSLYAAATALSLVFPVAVSIVVIILIQLNYVLAPRIPLLHRF